MLLHFKSGTVVSQLDTRLLPGLLRLCALMEAELGITELTITSVTDGVHKPNSKHYVGRAVDIRTKFFEDTVLRRVVDQFAAAGYLLLWESIGTPNEHFHLEYRGT